MAPHKVDGVFIPFVDVGIPCSVDLLVGFAVISLLGGPEFRVV